MNISLFIQARTGSTRLPGKVLMDLGGEPVLSRVLERALKARHIDDVVVLTTLMASDLAIVRLCAERGIRVFCGAENDVLDRFYQSAKILVPDHIVRITADCPVIDPDVIDYVVEQHLLSGADYTSNTLIECYPDGEDVEVFTFDALKAAWNRAVLASEREHVTPYIRNHPELFTQKAVIRQPSLSNQRWTLDTAQDYQFLLRLYDALADENKYFGVDRIVRYLTDHPDVFSLNTGIDRNEGLKKSLSEDHDVKIDL